jgi:hypothetical protein
MPYIPQGVRRVDDDECIKESWCEIVNWILWLVTRFMAGFLYRFSVSKKNII